jgi:hypothetical protein
MMLNSAKQRTMAPPPDPILPPTTAYSSYLGGSFGRGGVVVRAHPNLCGQVAENCVPGRVGGGGGGGDGGGL